MSSLSAVTDDQFPRRCRTSEKVNWGVGGGGGGGGGGGERGGGGGGWIGGRIQDTSHFRRDRGRVQDFGSSLVVSFSIIVFLYSVCDAGRSGIF